jgi:hypothetical protein
MPLPYHGGRDCVCCGVELKFKRFENLKKAGRRATSNVVSSISHPPSYIVSTNNTHGDCRSSSLASLASYCVVTVLSSAPRSLFAKVCLKMTKAELMATGVNNTF